jgi:hypothetical protein
MVGMALDPHNNKFDTFESIWAYYGKELITKHLDYIDVTDVVYKKNL